MTYISNTDADRAEMLAAIGVPSFEALIAPIPEAVRRQGLLNIPSALDEHSLLRHLSGIAAQNADSDGWLNFLGAGIYDHFRPTVVGALVSRGEFSTAYTPYQPELSQGMLQAIYEFQSLICALTQMDIANASMYDAATAMTEAALMSCDLSGRHEVVISSAVHPHYREVLKTYLNATGYFMTELPWSPDGRMTGIAESITDATACVILQHPNFWGVLDDLEGAVEAAHKVGANAVAVVDPISLGLLKPPGAFDVDIVVGEGQALGNPMAFGGPLLGFYACKKKFVRSFPGRIVGATHDKEGRRGYTMTLRTREQDIRREKATSNICTNEALLALAATVYLCEMGRAGLHDAANLCLQKSHYAADLLSAIPGVNLSFPSGRFFKEFVVTLPFDAETIAGKLRAHKILGGLPLSPYYPGMENALLVCVTETKTRADIDRFAAAIEAVVAEGEKQ